LLRRGEAIGFEIIWTISKTKTHCTRKRQKNGGKKDKTAAKGEHLRSIVVQMHSQKTRKGRGPRACSCVVLQRLRLRSEKKEGKNKGCAGSTKAAA